MNEAQAHAVLLVRALEEADAAGVLWGAAEREVAAGLVRAAAEAPVPPDADAHGRAREAVLVRRAECLLGRIEPRLSGCRWLRPLRWRGRMVAGLVVVAFALGVATQPLGPERRIHLLSAPLLGLVAWNLGVYLLLAWMALRGRWPMGPKRPPGPGPALLPEAVVSAGGWLRGHLARLGLGVGEPMHTLAEALRRYWVLQGPLTAPLAAARARGALHLGALALAAGCLAGMYWCGVVLEHRVYWESDFLDAAAVRTLLVLWLGPAAALSGRPLPDVEAIAALYGDAGGPAADWIHLYAVAVAGYILAPRALLCAWELRRARRAAADLRVDLAAGYYRRVLAAGCGAGERVAVRPFAWPPAPGALDALGRALHDHLGHQAHIEFLPPVPHAAGAGAGPETGATLNVALFHLGQTPEDEVHGAFLARLANGDGGRPRLMVVVAAAGFPGSSSDRRRCWDGFLEARGLRAAHVDLAPGAEEAVAATLAATDRPGTAGTGTP